MACYSCDSNCNCNCVCDAARPFANQCQCEVAFTSNCHTQEGFPGSLQYVTLNGPNGNYGTSELSNFQRKVTLKWGNSSSSVDIPHTGGRLNLLLGDNTVLNYVDIPAWGNNCQDVFSNQCNWNNACNWADNFNNQFSNNFQNQFNSEFSSEFNNEFSTNFGNQWSASFSEQCESTSLFVTNCFQTMENTSTNAYSFLEDCHSNTDVFNFDCVGLEACQSTTFEELCLDVFLSDSSFGQDFSTQCDCECDATCDSTGDCLPIWVKLLTVNGYKRIDECVPGTVLSNGNKVWHLSTGMPKVNQAFITDTENNVYETSTRHLLRTKGWRTFFNGRDYQYGAIDPATTAQIGVKKLTVGSKIVGKNGWTTIKRIDIGPLVPIAEIWLENDSKNFSYVTEHGLVSQTLDKDFCNVCLEQLPEDMNQYGWPKQDRLDWLTKLKVMWGLLVHKDKSIKF